MKRFHFLLAFWIENNGLSLRQSFFDWVLQSLAHCSKTSRGFWPESSVWCFSCFVLVVWILVVRQSGFLWFSDRNKTFISDGDMQAQLSFDESLSVTDNDAGSTLCFVLYCIFSLGQSMVKSIYLLFTEILPSRGRAWTTSRFDSIRSIGNCTQCLTNVMWDSETELFGSRSQSSVLSAIKFGNVPKNRYQIRMVFETVFGEMAFFGRKQFAEKMSNFVGNSSKKSRFDSSEQSWYWCEPYYRPTRQHMWVPARSTADC